MQDLAEIKKNNSIKISLINKLYSLIYYIQLVMLLLLCVIYLLNLPDVYIRNPVLTIVISFLTILALIVLIYSSTLFLGKFKLKLINNNIQHINLDNALKRTAKKIKFKYIKISDFEYNLIREISFFSWGDTITVITYDNKLFANNYPDIHPTIYNFHRKVLPNFEKAFNDIIENDSDVILDNQNDK